MIITVCHCHNFITRYTVGVLSRNLLQTVTARNLSVIYLQKKWQLFDEIFYDMN